ncbi:uncharacterized protein LOC116978047 isoform X14 [Amblyraja radiata]|uniref:uncharacterized protein LOC116978047 isoform X14 n=1 Tax=Amblyraja radiata TaxID=386614 RepID=UPI0014026036|nr:uncharacterized protein LOC116978047 isoform X14 [Amblyraja radiata]
MKMSRNVSGKNFISRIVFVSLISTVYTPGNVLPERKQNYTCRDSENQTIGLNVTLKTCHEAEMTINGTVVANEEGCQPPIINVIFGKSAVITGCHIILYRCFYNGTEEWLILTPIRTERNDPGLSTAAKGALGFVISVMIVIITIIIICVQWSNICRFTARYLKRFLPVSSPQTRIPTDDTANDQPTPSEAEAMKLVPSGDGERQETLESSKDDE